MPVSEARRRTRRVAGSLAAAWVLIVLLDVVLMRISVLRGNYTGIATLTGGILGCLLLGIHQGWAGRPKVMNADGRLLISARTLTGRRTVDLDQLHRVRRFSTISRGGGYIDEFRLRDRYGIRLSVENLPRTSAALRQVLQAARTDRCDSVALTRHARSGLGLDPRSHVPEALHRLWGVFMVMGVVWGPAVVSFAIACLLTGRHVL
ncbi:hypothetical protein SAMN05414137_120114 [Streptacidiphilus jiangxiensis]|uniref:Uncharacterized protein n=1 Tax=Streptacidiphilus jiangxiensis TaxID=235985 RepID=A0A1H7WF82_STRJI|nr:hypothetical protein SAMN05414137_120114 [Streptacidiphilus jiangxiensis]